VSTYGTGSYGAGTYGNPGVVPFTGRRSEGSGGVTGRHEKAQTTTGRHEGSDV
jgi:hypothetical protein